MVEGKVKKEYFITHENSIKFKFQYPQIKFNGNTDTATCLFTYCLQLLSWYKGRVFWPQKLKVFTIWPFTEKFANLMVTIEP